MSHIFEGLAFISGEAERKARPAKITIGECLDLEIDGMDTTWTFLRSDKALITLDPSQNRITIQHETLPGPLIFESEDFRYMAKYLKGFYFLKDLPA